MVFVYSNSQYIYTVKKNKERTMIKINKCNLQNWIIFELALDYS